MKHELKFPFVGSGDFKIYIYKEKETKGMKNEMKKKNNKGFSLVELIVVIAIMAVLMVVLAPAMLRYVEKTRVQKDESAAAEVRNAVELALADEEVAKAVTAATTINVTNKSIAAATSGDTKAQAIIDEVVKTTPAAKLEFTSKEHGTGGTKPTYEIVVTPASDSGFTVTAGWK